MAAMADPVSWLQIEQGWKVVASDGGSLSALSTQVEGDKQSDIFDGLAVVCRRGLKGSATSRASRRPDLSRAR